MAYGPGLRVYTGFSVQGSGLVVFLVLESMIFGCWFRV